MSASSTPGGRGPVGWRPRLAEGTGPVLVVLAVLLVALAFTGPAYTEPTGYLALLRRAAPLMILAVGQYFVVVCGGFDLSVGSLVTAEVVIAARLIDGDDSATAGVLVLLVALGGLVGLVNGLITTKLLVPSFIVTLGMLLVLDGAVFLWTGGAPRGALSPSFRVLGRGGVDLPVLGHLPWSVPVLLVVLVAAVVFMRAGTGRALVAVGDNPDAVRLAGGRPDRLRVLAFVLSGLLAALAAILLGGFAGVSAQVGEGLEFRAITAVVLGGVLLGGGRGSVVAAAAGALTLEALFSLLNLHGISGALESAVQGVIIIAAVAYAALTPTLRPRLPFRPGAAQPATPTAPTDPSAPTDPTAPTDPSVPTDPSALHKEIR